MTTHNPPPLSKAVSEILAPVPSPLARKVGKKRPKSPALEPPTLNPDPRVELRRLVGLHRRNANTIQMWTSPIADRTFKRGSETIVVKCALSPLVIEDAKRAVESLKVHQRDLVKQMVVQLKQVPIFQEFLSKVYGVGAGVTAAYLVAMVDIRRCPNVSNLIRYCGNAPDPKTGRRENRNAAPKYGPDGTFNPDTTGTFNSDLRRNNFLIMESMRKNAAKATKDRPQGSTSKYLERWHAATHAERTMPTPPRDGGYPVAAFHKGRMKATDLFLWDLYVMWRTLERLDIRPDKYSAVRGRWHGGGECVDQRYYLSLDEAHEIVGDPSGRAAEVKLVFGAGVPAVEEGEDENE